MKRVVLTLTVLVFVGATAFAQSMGKITGTVTDKATGEGIPFANVVLYQNGVQKTGAPTDFDGSYSISPVNPGTYVIKVQLIGYNTAEVQNVMVRPGATERRDIGMAQQVTDMMVVDVVILDKPLINQDNTTSSATMSAKEIKALPTRDVATMANLGAGTVSTDDGQGINVRGQRESGTVTYINGVKVIGGINLPPDAIEQMSVLTGGIPSQFGDVTGGVINITTKGASSEFFGGINAESGSMFDQWNQSVASISLAGPLLTKPALDADGNKVYDADSNVVKDTKLGYFLSAQWNGAKDPKPSAIGIYQVKDSVYEDLLENPLLRSGDGYIYKADRLLEDDFVKVKARPNVANNSVQLNGTLDFAPNDKTTISLGGSFDYNNGRTNIFEYSLLNSQNNPQNISRNYNVFARLKQNLGDDKPKGDSSSSVISNAYYQVQFDYSRALEVTQDPNHKDNLMRYGHVGYFTETRTSDPNNFLNYVQVHSDSLTAIASSEHEIFKRSLFYRDGNVYQIFGDSAVTMVGTANQDDVNNGLYYQFIEQSTELTFEESPYNALSANYLSHYFNMENEVGNTVSSLDQLQPNGLYFNGGRSNLIGLGLFYGSGRVYNGYSKDDQAQYRLSALASAEINEKHTFKFGFEFEQRDLRNYQMSPLGLWGISRQLVNDHLSPDLYDYSQELSSFTDNGIIYKNFRKQIIGEQSEMSKTIREKYGYDDYYEVQIDNIEPDDIKLADIPAYKLWDDFLVEYTGYDKLGNRIKNSGITFEDFYSDSTNRPQKSFTPNYTAFFIEDKFEINDFILRLGLRVDRYDANQNVLRDRYSMVPLQYVADADLTAFKNGSDINSVAIQDDWAILVDKKASEFENNQGDYSVIGFRDLDGVLYDAQGNEVPTLSYLSEDITNVHQWFYEPDIDLIEGQDISSNAFTDFKPNYNLMPRIAFSFPISEEAGFYAHYDVLTQRPDYTQTRILPSDFYAFRLGGQPFLSNPNLKPEKKINYQLGFQQKLTEYSALKIEAYYNEMRDQIGLNVIQNAYPSAYMTYENIDYSTSKGLTFTYDMRRKKNLSGNISYTLAFADGTGSSTSTSLTLLNQGYGALKFPSPLNFDQRHAVKANLDFRYGRMGEGKNAPKKKWLQNSGVNFTVISGSGLPYSRYASRQPEVLIGFAGQTKLDGTINGSRLPWNFRTSLKLDKDLVIRKESKEKDERAVNVYFYVQNLFNNRNILSVYNNTGQPDDDGYLATAPSLNEYQMAMYAVRLANPDNYSLPRRARLGFTYSF